MNVSSLFLATALGFSSTVGAVELSTGGQGQALIFPLYSVEAGNDTAIHITNSSDSPSIAKVRILEGLTGKVAYSFNLYLDAYDVWTGVLTRQDNGARLVSGDPTCTLPRLPAEGVVLGMSPGADPVLPTRARVGVIEVIEMGTPDPHAAEPMRGTLAQLFGDGCASLQGAFAQGGLWGQDSRAGLLPPRGGLSGSVTLTNVMNGYQIGLDATALLDFSTSARQTRPEDPQPTLGQSETTYATLRGTVLPFRNGVQAVSALLTHKTAQGEYAYGAGLNAETDWVVTYPTKAYLNALTTPDQAGERHSPFVTTPGPNGLTCEPFTTDLCAITNIIGIGDSNILGGRHVRTQRPAPDRDTGWISLWMGEENGIPEWPQKRIIYPTNAPALFDVEGLPMIGFSIIRIQNGDVGGLLANYVSVKRLTSIPHELFIQ